MNFSSILAVYHIRSAREISWMDTMRTKTLKLISSLLLLLFGLASSHVYSAPLVVNVSAHSEQNKISKKLIHITRSVLEIDGQINQDIHAQFWQELKRSFPNSHWDSVEILLRTSLYLAEDIAYEILTSADMSYQSGKVSKTIKLMFLENNATRLFAATEGQVTQSPAYEQIHNKLYQLFNRVKGETDKLLATTARHGSVKINSKVERITPELIERLRHEVELSADRLRKLFKQEWLD